MRPFVLSLSACFLVFSVAWAQNTSNSENIPQIPYGQSYKNFEFPLYEGSVLKYELSATLATGKSLNCAETINTKIEAYENGKVTTTTTSPNADIYPTERRMRTRNTVRIERPDMTITAQRCDFDLESKKYVLTDHVRVVLKNFDASSGMGSGSSGKHAPASPTAPSATALPAPPRPATSHPNDSLLDSPGAYSNSTNAGPMAPTMPASP